ncbi:uncharacterized protein isoform X3 [Salmo salar]|uniref:Uncharacterized protein isoform X3 n=1 Tax=Salmo salar TaxID=8030 RepID=A0ABM3CKJ5_SALSA|nr:uncharacterized protein LOC106589852 isoform X3 [Salmo salar]
MLVCRYHLSLWIFVLLICYLQLWGVASPRAPPPPPPPSLLPPLLSVDPPDGQVKRGQTLSFHCSPPPPHSQQSPKPEAFLLLRTAKATGHSMGSSMVHPQASLVSHSTAQTGAFHLGPVRGGEGGSYTCLYQVTVPRQGPANSTASHPVLVTVTELLPVPTLSLQSQAGEWALVCTGSPAFPGARFSLYRLGSTFPDATRSAPATRHRALFVLSSQDGPLSDQYQCQYSSLLGAEWSHSERSPLLAVPRVIENTTISPPSSPGLTGVDWPLVLGCLSVVVLFFIVLVGVGVAVQRKVKVIVEEKRKREGALLWAKLNSRDHVLDLTLKRVSITSQEWGNDDRAAETAFSRSPPWRTLSTFGNTPSS